MGGGITGAGVALDAAARGLRTALVEKADFASGTSSRSSKLVHGGLRYLQQGELRLVSEGLAERQRLLANAPHLVSVLPFLIPLFGRGGVGDRSLARAMGTALWLYDAAGGWRLGRLHRRVSAAEAGARMPTLRADRLVAGWIYYDAHADDARLTLAVARTAVLDHGAVAANRCPVVGLCKDTAGRVRGAVLEGGLEVGAGVVVNATGVWADEVRALDAPPAAAAIRPAKGVHLTIERSLVGNDVAVVLPVPGERRSIFVIPWGDRAYLGTTDTDYEGPLDDPTCGPDDVEYVLGALRAAARVEVGPGDVLGTWAGLRPLVAAAPSARTADLSRRHRVTTSPGGMVTVTGGKLTAYRQMAADTVDVVVAALGRGGRRSPTRRLRLRGAPGLEGLRGPEAAVRLGLAPAVLDHLAGRYGGEARAVAAMVAADPELGEPLVPGLPYLRAEAAFAARYEMAGSVDDVLARRTRARLLGAEAAAAAASDAAALVGRELGWEPERAEAEAAGFRSSVAAERAGAGLPVAVAP